MTRHPDLSDFAKDAAATFHGLIDDDDFNGMLDTVTDEAVSMWPSLARTFDRDNTFGVLLCVDPRLGDRILVGAPVIFPDRGSESKCAIMFAHGEAIAKAGGLPAALFFVSEAWGLLAVPPGTMERYEAWRTAHPKESMEHFPGSVEVLGVGGMMADGRQNAAFLRMQRDADGAFTGFDNRTVLYYHGDSSDRAENALLHAAFLGVANTISSEVMTRSRSN